MPSLFDLCGFLGRVVRILLNDLDSAVNEDACVEI
jgi:hypothetical protein